MEQKDHEIMEIIPLKSPYHINLKTINNIRFTDREIDVIACIIGGRSYKKIASFLSISPKTVEIHVHNIMLRLGCNSRENIIDFIEKSDKFALIKKHYSNLLIKVAFELELKKIFALTRNNSVNCLVFYYSKQKNKDLFIYELEKHFNLAGINTLSKIWEKGKAEKFLSNKLESQQINYIIYVLFDDFLEQLKQYEITNEAFSLITKIKQKPSHVIFLLLNEKKLLEINKKFSDFTFINTMQQENYYFLIFEIIKQLLPTINIANNIDEFKKQQTTFLQHSIFQILTTEDKPLQESSVHPFKNIKKLVMVAAINFLLIVCIGLIILHPNKYIQFSNKNDSITTGTPNIGSPQIESNYSKETIKSQHNLTVNRHINSVNDENNIKKLILLNLPPRNTKFTGRIIALEQIEEKSNKHKFGIITQTISGLGGVGKTHLATEFAYKAAEKNLYKIILWVTAETPSSINDVYREFAKFLQIDIRGLNPNDTRILVHRNLVEKYKDSKILFVLDNVSNYDNINDYITKIHKELSTYLSSHILITSRSQYWPDPPLILDTFSKEESTEFIKKHLREERKISIYKLAKTLHYYPLALSQAVAYIKRHTNIDDYLELYSIKRQDYLDKFPDDKDQYKETLWKTWNIALGKLGNTAQKILSISAYLYPDDIPITFFDDLALMDRTKAIEDLRKYSFISLTNNNKSFKLHRLLQEVIRMTMFYSKDNIKVLKNKVNIGNFYAFSEAIRLLKKKFNFSYTNRENWNLCSQYLTHAQTMAEHAVSIKNEFLNDGFQLYAQIAIYLTHIQQDNKHAIEIWEKLLTLVQQHYDKDDSSVLALANIYANMGLVMRQMGNMEQTEKYVKYTTSIYDKFNLLNISVNIENLLPYLRWEQNLSIHDGIKCDQSFALFQWGQLKQDMGDFEAAEISYKKALKILDECKQIKYTMIYRVSLLQTLANLYRFGGDIEQTKETLQSAKIIVDKEYANHMEQTYVYERIANLQYYVGEYNEARENLEKCLRIRLSLHAKEHYRIGYTKSLLGLILCAGNYINEGIVNLKQAEIIYNKNFTEGHPRFIFLYVHMNYAFERSKDYDQALQYFTKAKKIAENHKYLEGISSSLLAHQLTPIEELYSLDFSERNLNYYQQALNLTKQLFGIDHIRVARYHYLLGRVFAKDRNREKARYHYQEALNIANKQSFKDKELVIKHHKNIKTIQMHLQKLQS